MERTTKNIVSTLLHETGSTLVVGLLTLILLSLIGVAATTSSRTEVEVAGNDKTAKEAFYAAELGLATGEGVIESMANRVEFEEGTIAGHYGQATEPAWRDLLWNNTDSQPVPTSAIPDGLARMAAPPRYTIEERDYMRDSLTLGIGAPTGVYLFTVTAHGTGGNAISQADLRSIYAKRFN
jgi:type IV pilus assembly protein PilX